MLTTMMLSVLLVLGGLGGAAASDLHVFGKSFHSDDPLESSHDSQLSMLRKQLRQQTKRGIRRSLDLESFNIRVSPTSSKLNLPTVIKLYPPTAKPLHMHANMPLRFGRESDDRVPNSSPNMPQRFGRSWEVLRMCGGCRSVREAQSPVLPQRFGRNTPHWGFLNSLASEQLLNPEYRWKEDIDLPTSSEEEEMEGKDIYNMK
ncbi:Pro-FMRFamide-related neuropeptide VF [Oryzias melastigma]|uniref:Pro-FMRFamide-related neuropeptide VF n=1 Tax=Oryzias melastigma TaxID=30732 RepID=A0A3B3DSK0_ORYME|nr:pro-FMRFamide-related neuropeptide VF [Oryzias melastigma]KAF6716737.1 Pro-FMRFamide-related neuropeptide VF [Oryzias melastigma]